jgi:hypothetical protein
MNKKWIVVAFAGALVAGCSGCKSHSKKSKPETKPQVGAIKPLPGTEAVQSLLTGVGKSATPSQGTAVALGGLFGKGGVLGSGPSLGMGVTGSTGAGTGAKPVEPTTPTTADEPSGVEPDTTYGGGDDSAEATATTPPVNVPPPAAAGGDCRAVAARVGDLARAMMDAQLASIDAEARAQTEEMVKATLASIPPMIEHACTQQQWPQELKDCVLTGTSLEALQTCDRYVTPQMRAAAEAQATAAQTGARPTTPAPVWTKAASDCTATAEHAVALAEWELSAAPDEIRANGTAMLPQIRSAVEDACTAGAWPAQTRTCILQSSSVEAMNACTAAP